MAHVRARHLKLRFEKLCKFNPLVGVFGHRQTGKTTFTEESAATYVSFDQEDSKNEAEGNATKFLKKIHSKRTVIDECQMVPKVFPALKEWVRTHKQPGQFILTGSVKFTSRIGVRESLTGRIGTTELLPLTVAEILEKPLSDSLTRLMKAKDLFQLEPSSFHSNHHRAEKKSFEIYLSHGGLPGICFVRDAQTRSDYLQTLIHLMLDFDLRQVAETKLSLRTLQNLLAFIARGAMKPYSYAVAKRTLKISEQTQKKILNALESIYVLRRLKVDGAKGDLFLLEDQLEERVLSGSSLARSTQLITAVYRNVRAQFVYRSGEIFEFFQYRTRGGALVPLAVRTDTGVLGFIVIQERIPSLSEKRSAESFIRKYPQAKVLFLSADAEAAIAVAANQLVVPISSIL